jgi:PPK2 family polyphosphate:nucleotide phosphotransferase
VDRKDWQAQGKGVYYGPGSLDANSGALSKAGRAWPSWIAFSENTREKTVSNNKNFSRPFKVGDPEEFRLKQIDPDDTAGLKSKEKARDWLEKGIVRLSELQEKLYAQDRWALLLIFQAMDAAGKDGTIKHVMSGVNPQGCQVFSFKAPSEEELDHDFLWRTTKCLPERGRIGIFNRSYYEETLVVRVHPELLGRQKIPSELVTKNIWKDRFKDINAFERYMARNGVMIRKFFLHISYKEQRKRFLSRLDESSKNWKFSLGDVQERRYWKDYMKAYEDAIRNTSTRQAPWYVIPANNKWFTRLAVADAVIEALEEMNLSFPKVSDEKLEELKAARTALEEEVGSPRESNEPIG